MRIAAAAAAAADTEYRRGAMRQAGIAIFVMLAATCAGADGLGDRIVASQLTLPQNLEGNISSWLTWGSGPIGPRLYLVPKNDGTLFLGWTDSAGTGRISLAAGSSATTIDSFPGDRLKGLVAHDDGSYAVLRWNSPTETMRLAEYDPAGNQQWATIVDTANTEFDDWLGDSRLTYGNGTYAAYYTVYGTGSWMAGHHGDQLRYVNGSGSIVGGWEWGCSHSMAELISWDDDLGFVALCSSDCYPSKGLVKNNSQNLVPSDGNCGGLVSLQLGQMAAGEGEWKAVFNAMDMTCCDGFGIGFVRFGGAAGTDLTWLTNSNGTYERDPVMARLPDAPAGADRYLVGWRLSNTGEFFLAVVSGDGSFIEGPDAVGGQGIAWGNRDDSFQSRPDGSVSWVHGNASSSTITLFTYREDAIFADGFESGGYSNWSGSSP
jgi:hypothetical protein